MKTRIAVYNHDLEYGRDIRIAGAAALVLVTLAFLFAPQPGVEPYQLRRPVVMDFVSIEPTPTINVPTRPVEPTRSSVPLPSDNPEAVTIDPNTDFHELKPDVTVTSLPAELPFIKVERKPRLMHSVQPEYPEMARAAGIEGKVVVSVVVDTLGNVSRAEVYATSGNTLLDHAAIEAASKCGFTPGYQRDRAVIVRNVILPFHFRLQ